MGVVADHSSYDSFKNSIRSRCRIVRQTIGFSRVHQYGCYFAILKTMLARPTPAEPSLVPTPPVSGRSTGSNLRRASGSGDANGTGYAKQQLRSTRSVSEASTGRTKAEHVEGNIQLCDVM